MVTPEKRNAAPAGTGNRAEYVVGKTNYPDITPVYTAMQRRTAARLAARFGFSASVALVVVTLAGIGGGQ